MLHTRHSDAVLGQVSFVEGQFRLEPLPGNGPLRFFIGVGITMGDEQLVEKLVQVSWNPQLSKPIQ